VKADYFLSLLFPDAREASEQYRSGAYFEKLATFDGRYELTKVARPFLVRFRDIKDKRSVELYPSSEGDRESRQITSANLSISSTPATHRLLGILPWLKDEGALSYEGLTLEDPRRPLASLLNRTHFQLIGEI
jgi:hypothetical protein